MSLKNVYFILVRPQMGENIGSVARAIKNSLSNSNNIPIVARLQGRGDDEAAQILSDSPSVFLP